MQAAGQVKQQAQELVAHALQPSGDVKPEDGKLEVADVQAKQENTEEFKQAQPDDTMTEAPVLPVIKAEI